ncbi:hypothetical protein G6O67_005143 [Ophiocordyceps sinensis]|uniref:PAN2-PAN3 deadenylation complex subunit PAN3 n=1 Tax=Ophiocordyceps sinensis TaxID=72228 RepID=A0A8H4PQX5_9HYPO|nr:hypothetical protein G6O67_005143 [Ophiocordyceps sinensis]
MAASRFPQTDLRRQVPSPRPKTHENKETLCRNVLIYGHCRYEDQGCKFSHDLNKNNNNGNQPDLSKKALNVESPSFIPSNHQTPPLAREATIPTQAASASAFTPRALGAGAPVLAQADPETAVFNPASIREFTPSFDVSSQAGVNGSEQDGTVPYDPFTMAVVAQSMPTASYNPYSDDIPMAASSSFFQPQGAFSTALQPLQHHLYAPAGPRRQDLMPYHRMTRDFFIPEKMRQDLLKKAEATLQTIPNSQLPQLDNYHSLVALDTTHRKNANIFGYPSWVYKATSSKTGHRYCLRRLEGFRLTNEHAIRSVNEWKKIFNANVVTTHDAFTARAFGDSSLIFVQDYHPISKTLAEAHLTPSASHGTRNQPKGPLPESILWAYITQMANAIKAIHSANLAARCIDASKIILTDTDRNTIRLNACSVLDVVQFDMRRPVHELQQEDLLQFGRTMLCLATSTPPVQLTNPNVSVEQMSRSYSTKLRDTIVWLLTPQQPSAPKTIDEFARGIAGHMMTVLDQSLRGNDEFEAVVSQALENGRVARLLLKLGAINERYEFDGDPAWSENGERYMLKLYRDYVFHQVDSNGNPVLDLGHMIRCLNNLDAGTDEKICLTSRDEQTSFLISYKELKKMLGNAHGELLKRSKQGREF